MFRIQSRLRSTSNLVGRLPCRQRISSMTFSTRPAYIMDLKDIVTGMAPKDDDVEHANLNFLNIAFFANKHNSLSQRLALELEKRHHKVKVRRHERVCVQFRYSAKTEMPVLSARHRPCPSLSSITICDDVIGLSPKARNIGVIMDSNLTMEVQVTTICKSGFYYLRKINKIRKYLRLLEPAHGILTPPPPPNNQYVTSALIACICRYSR